MAPHRARPDLPHRPAAGFSDCVLWGPARPGESAAESGLPEADEADILEERGRDYKRDEKGRFAGGGGGGIRRKKGGTKYAPSPQRNHAGIQMKPKEYAKLCGTFNTRYPRLKPEDGARPYCECNPLVPRQRRRL